MVQRKALNKINTPHKLIHQAHTTSVAQIRRNLPNIPAVGHRLLRGGGATRLVLILPVVLVRRLALRLA